MSEPGDEREGSEGIWVRALYMLLFVLLYSVAEFVMVAVVLVQFGYRVFNEASHPRLLALGGGISRYIYQVLRYLSFNSEVMPYPFSEWPAEETADN